VTTVVSADFDSEPLGSIDPGRVESEVGGASAWTPGYNDVSIVSDGSGGRAVRVALEKGTILSKPEGSHGMVLLIRFADGYDQACISYRVRFDANFDWSLGGKLPGLAGVAPGVSGGAPSGGNPTDEGWSGRLMWLGNGSYGWVKASNMVVSYMYHPGQETQYGDNIQWNRELIAGKWHSVKQCYTMNTVGQNNGTLRAWFDNQLVVDQSNFVYRTRSDVHINYLYWDVFRGGSTLEWAGDRTGYVDIDDMLVTAGG